MEGFTRTEIEPSKSHSQRRTPPPSYPPPSFSSSGRENAEEQRERVAAAALLKSCKVKYYGQLARDYPPALIRAKVEEWRVDPDLGPGMLVKMIQGGGPIIGDVRPIERPALPADDEGDWHRQRYESGRRRADEGEDEGVRIWRGDD